jgi:CPA2 family monovalent cation:H+ antiporter-2
MTAQPQPLRFKRWNHHDSSLIGQGCVVRLREKATMDATTTFVADVTVALIVGSAAGAAVRSLRITPIVGYIIAGVIIGPFTPGYVARGTSLSGLAELGLIFLLFSLGLGFSLRELRMGGVSAVVFNLLAMACSAAAVWGVFVVFGLTHPITLALAFTVSSTAVGATLMQTLEINAKRAGAVALSLLITQDLAAVILLVIISTPAQALSLYGIALPLARAVVFVALALILGATLLHRLFLATLHRAGAELLVVIFSAVALAAAWLGHLAGLTFEFGAFVAGAVTSEAAGSHMVQSVVRPFRELFVMLFFVSMGTFIDISSIAHDWPAVLAVAAVAIVVRFGLWTGLARMVQLPIAAAVAVGITLLPMAEFNIVLGQASFVAGRLTRPEFAILVGVCLLSILASALSTRFASGALARPISAPSS